MAGKKKSGKGNKGKKKQEKKLVDEYQLRRDLRDQRRRRDESELTEQETTVPRGEEIMSKRAEEIRIGGIEGGGTHSTLLIIDGKGNKLTEIKGPDTNHWILGMEETVARISAMIEKGKEALNIPASVPLECVGLSLSGCEEENTNRLLSETLREKYPNAAKDYLVCSDTLGSLRTGCEQGGIVLIAGTGSNGLLINSDGKTHGCGGWGYMMGDEGSAYWIAHRACKYVFDDIDGFLKAPAAISYVWPAMRNYFSVSHLKEMLPHFYTNFDKSKVASFTKEIAIGCERKDPLCLMLLREAGALLARNVNALWKKASTDLTIQMKVICVGSVWNSWEFMKEGFVQEINEFGYADDMTLYRLRASSALGACYLAAEKINCPFTKPYKDNTEVLFHFQRGHYVQSEARLNSPPSTVKCVTRTL